MKRSRGNLVWMVVGLVVCVAAGSASAVVTSFQEGVNGYTGTADTYLDNDSATPSYNTANYGGFGWMRVGKLTAGMEQAGLVRFDNIVGPDPGQIPAGATILNATLRMTAFAVKNHPGWTGNFHYAVPMLTSWVEGSVTREASYPFYSTTEEGASCADYRHYRASGNYAAGDHWGTSGNPNTNGPVAGLSTQRSRPVLSPLSVVDTTPSTTRFRTTTGIRTTGHVMSTTMSPPCWRPCWRGRWTTTVGS